MKIGIHIRGEALFAALEALAAEDGRDVVPVPFAADTGDLSLGRLSLTEAGTVALTVRRAASRAWEIATDTHEAQGEGFTESRRARAERIAVLAGILDTEGRRLGEIVKRARIAYAGGVLEGGEPPADFDDPEHGQGARRMTPAEVDELVAAIASSRKGGDHGER